MKFAQFDEIRSADGNACYRSSAARPADAQDQIRVIIADDHPVVTQGVRYVLERAPRVSIVAEVYTISDMMQQLKQHPCDILLCDYSFDDDPEPDGLRLIERVRQTHPNVRIILLTMLHDQCLLRHIVKRGISAFLSKASTDLHELPGIVADVMQGKTYIDAQIASALLFNIFEKPQHAGGPRELSAREFEIVRLYEEGLTVTDIAARLNRSRKTITTQKASAMKKLGVASNQALIDAVRSIL